MKKICTLFFLFCFSACLNLNSEESAKFNPQTASRPKNAEEALKRLMEGNKRYSTDMSTCEDRNYTRRAEIASKQTPFVAILGCSDSRVPLEIIFDQGLGDLFGIRVAGNVAGISEIESVEYAAKHLGVSLIMVLGHENCGAVKAVINNQAQDIPKIAALIEPAVKSLKNDQAEAAVKANIRQVVKTLKDSEYVKPFLNEKGNFVVGAYYHLGSGVVELLD